MLFLWFSDINSHWVQRGFGIGREQFLRLEDMWAASRSWALLLSWRSSPWPFCSLAKYQFFPLQSWESCCQGSGAYISIIFFIVYILSRAQNCEPLPRVCLQVSPRRACPQWTLFEHIVKLSVISGSNQSGFGSNRSLPMTLSFHSS